MNHLACTNWKGQKSNWSILLCEVSRQVVHWCVTVAFPYVWVTKCLYLLTYYNYLAFYVDLYLNQVFKSWDFRSINIYFQPSKSNILWGKIGNTYLKIQSIGTQTRILPLIGNVKSTMGQTDIVRGINRHYHLNFIAMFQLNEEPDIRFTPVSYIKTASCLPLNVT